MRRRTLVGLIVSIALLTVPLAPMAGGQISTSSDVFIYEDPREWNFWSASKEAADNLGLPYDTTTDPCEVAEAADASQYRLLVIENSVDYMNTGCEDDLFAALDAYAQEGGTLVFQSWEIGECLIEDPNVPEVTCDEDTANGLLETLGVATPTVHDNSPTLETAPTANACHAAPNPLLPAGLDQIQPERSGFLSGGFSVDADATTAVCLVDAEQGQPMMTVNANGVYIGVFSDDYFESQDALLPGPQDMVRIYENTLVSQLP